MGTGFGGGNHSASHEVPGLHLAFPLAGSAARNAAGWEVCLDRLAGLEPGADAWPPRFEAYSAAFTPALGPQEGPPPGYKGD
jgi:hypothetical protein